MTKQSVHAVVRYYRWPPAPGDIHHGTSSLRVAPERGGLSGEATELERRKPAVRGESAAWRGASSGSLALLALRYVLP
jgi:hypothetical protein